MADKISKVSTTGTVTAKPLHSLFRRLPRSKFLVEPKSVLLKVFFLSLLVGPRQEPPRIEQQIDGNKMPNKCTV